MSEDSDYEYEMKGKHPINPLIFNSKWRVKLYKLNYTGQWDDMGTGYVSVMNEEKDYFIKMFSETDNDKIFELKITNDIEFHRQRGTILTWKGKEEEDDDDSAISFQDKEGVQEVWKFICYLKGKEYQEEICEYEEEDEEILPDPSLENLSYIARELRMENAQSRHYRILEKLNLDNGLYIKKLGDLLDNEERKLEERKSEITKETKETKDSTENKDAETKNISQFEHLSLVFTIFKNILHLADQNLLELLVSDDLYMITFGALEYDFESTKMIKHRQFFKDQVTFKNLLSITNKDIIEKIHMNHRLTYLRDTATGRFIEEITIRSINSILNLNNTEIIQYFLTNENLLRSMIEKIKDEDLEIRSQGISFLLELISCGKEIIHTRLTFFEALCEYKILEVLQNILIDTEKHYSGNLSIRSDESINEDSSFLKLPIEEAPKIAAEANVECQSTKNDKDNTAKEDSIILAVNKDKEAKAAGIKYDEIEKLKDIPYESVEEEVDLKEKIRINSIEILINIVTLTPTYFKNYLTGKTQKSKDHPLLEILCNILLYHDNFGIKYEISELLRSLLDNDFSEKKNEIYEIFLNKCLSKLIDYLSTVIDDGLSNKYKIRSTKQIIVEIICHCLKSHGQRFKYWAIHNDLIPKVVEITKDKEKILDLQVVKFIKSILMNGDDNLVKIVISNNCFKRIIDLFEANRVKKNLVFSAILDLFDTINKNTIKKIILHLFDNFNDFIRDDSNKDYFKNLIHKYNQGLDQYSQFRISESEEKTKYQLWNRRELSAREDEDYFSEDDDDIFKDDQIIKNLEKEEAKFQEQKIQEVPLIHSNKDAEDKYNNNNIIREAKDHANKIMIGDSGEDNLALLKELSENKDENIKQLLKRKKLSEDDDDNEKTLSDEENSNKNSKVKGELGDN